MRRVAALCVVSCFLLTACNGSGGDVPSSGAGIGGGKTLEQLWRSSGDDVAVVPGTDHYVPGDVRFSFLVVDSSGRPVILPTARVWIAHARNAKPFLDSAAKPDVNGR